MQYLHTNNASSNLRNAIAPGALNITVTSGHGALFPNPGVDQGFFVTVEDRRSGRLEIMLCTQRIGDSLTVTRGQQGTVPQNFVAGVSVANRITAQILNEFVAATVNVIPPARIPPITSAMIDPAGLDTSVIKTGVFVAARIPTITNGMLAASGFDAAKITVGILPDARLPTPIADTHLPNIPSAKLTSVPAQNLTGTINMDRIANLSVTDAKIAGMSATKLTGTIDDARFPQSFTVTGQIKSNTLVTEANANFAGDISGVNDITVRAGHTISARLEHHDHGGYVNIGAFSASYGSGFGQYYWSETDQRFTFKGEVRAEDGFVGQGQQITGVVKTDVGIGAVGLLFGPGGGHSAGDNYDVADLRRAHIKVNTSDNSLSVSFDSPSGVTWRAMQSGSASASQRCLGIFVRTS